MELNQEEKLIENEPSQKWDATNSKILITALLINLIINYAIILFLSFYLIHVCTLWQKEYNTLYQEYKELKIFQERVENIWQKNRQRIEKKEMNNIILHKNGPLA